MSPLQVTILVVLAAGLLAAGLRVRALSARLRGEERRRSEAEAEAARLQAEADARGGRSEASAEESGGRGASNDNAQALRRVNAELVAARDDALAASRAKSAFLANMGHELRTPLNAILGYTELIQEECEDAGHVAYVDDLKKIRSSGRQLLDLINGVLDLSRMETGRTDVRVETVDVRWLAEEIVATVLPLAQLRRNTVALEVAPDAATMRSDPGKVRQILYDLLRNACKVAEGGHIAVGIARNGEQLIVTVRHVGTGVDQAQVAALSAFSDGSSPDVGTELTVSRRLASMLGGEIVVQSDPNAGTTLAAHLSAMMEPPARPPDRRRVDRGRGVVLVVDDDPNVRDLATRHLSMEGFLVTVAEDGESALRAAQRLRPDLITLDVLLPGMDGWRVLRALKADPDLADVPVVMVTMLDEMGSALAVGAEAWLTKPLSRDTLVRTVRRCIGDAAGETPTEAEAAPASSRGDAGDRSA